MAITSVPLCGCDFCPAKNDPFWHHCVVCGSDKVSHDHFTNRGMGGSKKKYLPHEIIPLCPPHHEMVTLRTWIKGQAVLPGRGLYQWILDLHGKTIWERWVDDVQDVPRAGSDRAGQADALGALPTVHSQEVDGDGRKVDGHTDGHGGNEREDTPIGERAELGARSSHGTDSESPRQAGPYDRWVDALATLAESEKQTPWLWGDTLNRGEDLFTSEFTQAFEVKRTVWISTPRGAVDTGLSYKTLSNRQWVARRFTEEQRHHVLSWAHYRAFAAIEGEERVSLLLRAEREGWTVAEATRQLKGPRVKIQRWTLEELREKRRGWCDTISSSEWPIVDDFLNWLEAQR